MSEIIINNPNQVTVSGKKFIKGQYFRSSDESFFKIKDFKLVAIISEHYPNPSETTKELPLTHLADYEPSAEISTQNRTSNLTYALKTHEALNSNKESKEQQQIRNDIRAAVMPYKSEVNSSNSNIAARMNALRQKGMMTGGSLQSYNLVMENIKQQLGIY
jgi:hypothetical protein